MRQPAGALAWLNRRRPPPDDLPAEWTLTARPVFSADVATGAGVLTNNNAFVVVNQSGATLATAPATFTGIYDLNGGTRNVDVREGNAPVGD